MNDSIQLNGQPHAVQFPLSVSALLVSLGLEGKPVVVELDEQAVLPRDYASVEVKSGSKVEVVTLAAGG
jgi:sulfur carrier protein